MQPLRTRIVRALVLIAALSLAACGAGTGGQTTGGTPSASGSATAQPKAAKPKPTGVPAITVAFCQGLVTVAEANQIMKPATPATAIRVDSTTNGGSCNYEYSKFHAVVSALFLPYQSGVSLDAIATQSLAQAQSKGANITKTTVSGVGDQALYITATFTITTQTIYYYYLDTTYGNAVISCWSSFLGSAPGVPQQPALTQVCKQVLSGL